MTFRLACFIAAILLFAAAAVAALSADITWNEVALSCFGLALVSLGLCPAPPRT